MTDSARILGTTKWAVTRALDALEKQDVVERQENRKTVLTLSGKKLAEKCRDQMKILEQYMQYQDIPPAQIKENALRALSAGFSDEFMERLAEQEGRMRLKGDFCRAPRLSWREYLQLPQETAAITSLHHLPGADQEPQQPLHGKPWF